MDEKQKKTYKYLVTMRWYVETDEELISGAIETDNKLLNLVQHRSNGEPCGDESPTKNFQGYAVLPHHDFMGDKPIYMSKKKLKVKI